MKAIPRTIIQRLRAIHHFLGEATAAAADCPATPTLQGYPFVLCRVEPSSPRRGR